MNQQFASIKDLMCDIPEGLQEYLFEEFELAAKETDDLRTELEETKAALVALQVKYQERERDTKLIIHSLKKNIETKQNLFEQVIMLHSLADQMIGITNNTLGQTIQYNNPITDAFSSPIRQSNDQYCNFMNGEIRSPIRESNHYKPEEEPEEYPVFDEFDQFYGNYGMDFYNMNNEVDKLCNDV